MPKLWPAQFESHEAWMRWREQDQRDEQQEWQEYAWTIAQQNPGSAA